MPLIIILSDRSSLSILVVPNAYLAFDDHLSPTPLSPTSFTTTSFSSSSPGPTSTPPPPPDKLITRLLQTIARTTINFGFVNLTHNSQFGVISIRSPTPYSPSNTTILSFIKKCDGTGKPLSVVTLRHIALNFLLTGRDTSSVALSWCYFQQWKKIRQKKDTTRVMDNFWSFRTV
ncbi:hypothetical protein JHK86_010432 [Glycine max]|nr:hypothetical protein JHK86_010432 [Glycine max]